MNCPIEVNVIGAGGHAKVIIRALQDLGAVVHGVFDDDPRCWGKSLLGIPVAGPTERLKSEPRRPAVIAVGDNTARRRLAERLDLPWFTVVHPLALVDRSATLGRGTVVLARAVVQVDSSVGDHAIINHAATVDHDCTVGHFTHLAPGVHLAGGVVVGDGSLLGVGALAIPGVRIGPRSTVGAGSTVIRDLPGDAVAAGSPARILAPPPHAPLFYPSPTTDWGIVSLDH